MTTYENRPDVEEGRMSVLIADDDARVRHALRTLLELDTRMVVAGEASSTGEVLTCDEALQPTVILLDLVLPSAEDGMDLLKLLARTEARPVVAMSLRGGLRDEAMAAGAAAFVEKDVTPDQLLAAICEACRVASGAWAS